MRSFAGRDILSLKDFERNEFYHLFGIADRLELAFERLPALARAGIKDVINGPFTFGPDGNPMIGPVPGMKNYWVAEAGDIHGPDRSAGAADRHGLSNAFFASDFRTRVGSRPVHGFGR